MAHTSDILLFAAQGSNAHYANRLADYLQDKPLETRRILEDFLQRCFHAFHEEIDSLTGDEEGVLGTDVRKIFDKPESLVTPPSSYQSNAILESITFYVHQIFDLVIFFSRNPDNYVSQTSGVCSGMIACAVAASFPESVSAEFLKYAVDGFRLAFWIGVRVSIFCHKISGGQSNEPWAVTIRGCSAEQLQEKVDAFNAKSKRKLPLSVSAVFGDDMVSLTGEPQTLRDFKETALPSSVPARYPHVHGYYHGGSAMDDVVQEILADVQKRAIIFPDWGLIEVPILSTATGQLLDSSHPLLEVVLQHMLLDPVDWKKSWEYLQTTTIKATSSGKVRAVLLGPNTGSLRLIARSSKSNPNMEFVTVNSTQPSPTESEDNIAIVGMSARFPSGEDTTQFWDMLKHGINAVSEVPATRFDISQYFNTAQPSNGDSRWMPVKHGNFLSNPFQFDNSFFNISPREAKSIDPQQRLLLHASFEALEDAGYAPDATNTFQRETMGVYVGVATGDYVDNLRDSQDVYYSPGTLRAFLSGRISYAFGLKGPSVVIDTACSSSLVAIYQACRAIQAGECTAALAGGVNVISSPDMYLGLARAHFLSQTGQCKPFDEGADGYCRAEGCGVVVLKRLSQAVAEGDRILGVIRGAEVNQCGEAKSITHPDHRAQAALLKKLIQKSGVSPDSISFVEAHGTGTQAGDYEESRSIKTTVGAVRSADNPLYIGSLKGNIGHAEAASGIAGLSKLLLMLKHKQIPPQSSLVKVNPRLGINPADNIIIPTQLLSWNTAANPCRTALLNNFGAAGSNAAIIVQEYAEKRQTQSLPPRSCHVLNVSAKSAAALERLREQLISFIEANGNSVDLSSLCYSVNARREEFDAYRLSAIGGTHDELLARLREEQIVPRRAKQSPKTVFVFSGQGGIHCGMGNELFETLPLFQEIAQTCDNILQSHGFHVVTPYLSGDSAGHAELSIRDKTIVEHCSCFVLEFSLAKSWMIWGVKPDLLVGHSLGEYAAFSFAGIISLRDALLLVARRAELMARLCESDSTSMVACRLSPPAIQDLLTSHPKLRDLSISCENGPEDTVVAGPIQSLDTFIDICKSRNNKATKLDVAFGYHSSAMDPMMTDFRHLLSSVKLSAPRLPIASTLYGRILSSGELITSDYFAEQARGCVKLYELAQNMAKAYTDTSMAFLEIGPSPATIPKFKGLFDTDKCSFIPSLSPKESPWLVLSRGLRTLYLERFNLKWREVYDGTGSQFIDGLPRYPLATTEFVVPFQERYRSKDSANADDARLAAPSHEFINQATRSEKDSTVEFPANVDAMAPYIKAHVVGEIPMCPASVYVELALEAADVLDGPTKPTHRLISDVTFENPYVYHEEETAKLNITLRPDATATEHSYAFESLSSTRSSYCNGSLCSIPLETIRELILRKTAFVQRQKESVALQTGHQSERFSANTMYNIIFPRVVAYGEPLETMKHLNISSSGLEGFGTFQLPSAATKTRFICHPAFVDTMLHATGFIANFKVNAETACICSKIDRIVLPMDAAELSQELDIYCSLVDVGHSVVGDSYVLNRAGEVIAWVEGMAFKKLSLRSFKSHLSRIARASGGASAAPPAKTKSAAVPVAINPSSTPRGSHSHNSALRLSNINGIQQEKSKSSLYAIIREVCGLDSSKQLDPMSTLEELGIDSLLLIELSDVVKQRFPQASNVNIDLESCQTVQDIEKAVCSSLITETFPPSPAESAEENMLQDSEVVVVQPTTPNQTITLDGLAPSHVQDVLREVFGLDITEADKFASLDSLGVDSLGAMELAHELQERFKTTSLRDHDSIPSLTVDDLERMIEKELATTATATMAPPTPASSGSTFGGDEEKPENSLFLAKPAEAGFPTKIGKHVPGAPALYLFHDGSGKSSMYARLALPGYNLFGVFSLDFGAPPNPDIKTLEDLARLYIDRAGLASCENVLLGGWSFGGVLAYEVARQLQRQGGQGKVRGVILIDSPAPEDHQALPEAVVSRIVGRLPTSAQTRASLAAQFNRHAALLQSYHPGGGKGESKKVRCVLIHCTRNFDTEALCGVAYPWLGSAAFRAQSAKTWARLVGADVPVLDLDCDHFAVFESSNVS
ncbi:hypothetical protein F4809DRAFT_661582 [Biscogniauxia mediterranea]|nr:hypothetical protein F4809DRAFT_661582 [Biscogniauxia mediterranea]